MVIFGVDPGSSITGYGVIRVNGNQVRWVDSGVIRTGQDSSLAVKLGLIYDGLSALMQTHRPDWVCIEEAFYAKNVHTTLVLGHARGVAMLAAHKAAARIAEYSPRAIKQAVVGKGGAQKEQVAYMVRLLVAPPKDHDQVDACDALAAALCGMNSIKAQVVMERRT
jgi:crossover junction endodeoxyribonuclease RuvC